MKFSMLCFNWSCALLDDKCTDIIAPFSFFFLETTRLRILQLKQMSSPWLIILKKELFSLKQATQATPHTAVSLRLHLDVICCLFYSYPGPLRNSVVTHSCFHEHLRRQQLCHRHTMLMPFWGLGALRFKCPLNPQPNILVVWRRHIDTLGEIKRSSAIDFMNAATIVKIIHSTPPPPLPTASPAEHKIKKKIVQSKFISGENADQCFWNST